MSYEPGLNIGPGDDTTGNYDSGTEFDSDATFDAGNAGEPGGVYTPDPFGAADQAQYSEDGAADGPDVPVPYLPPWAITRAPGTKRTIAAGEIIPINPWNPVIALLNAEQLAMLNRESAARQAAAYYVDDPRQM